MHDVGWIWVYIYVIHIPSWVHISFEYNDNYCVFLEPIEMFLWASLFEPKPGIFFNSLCGPAYQHRSTSADFPACSNWTSHQSQHTDIILSWMISELKPFPLHNHIFPKKHSNSIYLVNLLSRVYVNYTWITRISSSSDWTISLISWVFVWISSIRIISYIISMANIRKKYWFSSIYEIIIRFLTWKEPFYDTSQ